MPFHLIAYFSELQLQMGKLKKGRRNQRSRINPVARKNGVSGKQEAKDENTRQNKIVPLIAKLSSSAANDRSVALSAITVLAEDTRMRKMLLKEKLVATVMEQTLTDSDDEIVVESFGLLRNLAIEEGHDVAKFLWRSNIWASIESGLQKIETSFEVLNNDPKKLEKKRALLLYDFAENLLSLVVLIASCSDELYNNVYEKIDPVLKLVVDLINWNIPKLRTSMKMFNALLDFIYEFASDSAEFISKLAEQSNFSLPLLTEALQLRAHEKNALGKVYVEGIKFHIYEVENQITDKEAVSASILKSVFGTVTSIDLETISKQLGTTDNANEPIQKNSDSEKPQDMDVAFGGDSPEKSQARSDLQAIDVTIDLLTTICEYLAINEASVQEPVQLGNDTVACLLELAYPSCLHLLAFDQDHDEVLLLTQKLLVSLNNMCWLFLSNEVIPVAWYSHIPQLWDAVEKVSQKDNLEYQRVCLSVLWAICKTVGPEVRDKVTLQMVQGLLGKCQELTRIEEEDPSSSLDFILSAVGFLGSVAQVIGNTETTKEISEFLLAQSSFFLENNNKEPRAMEIAMECLNLIYDIFGDAEFEYDLPVFVEGNYVERLTQMEPLVRACYKQIDKKRNVELKLKAEEVWTNLGRFVEYKKSERS